MRGPALERLGKSLYAAADAATSARSPPASPSSSPNGRLPGEPEHAATWLPAEFRHHRSELGEQIYGAPGLGLERTDIAGRREAVLRNFQFFGAPAAVVVCMSSELRGGPRGGTGDAALCVGLYLQTLLLALAEAGVGSCVQIAPAAYPDVVREAAGIPEHLHVLCTVSVGYEDPDAKINHCRASREPVGKTTVWVDE